MMMDLIRWRKFLRRGQPWRWVFPVVAGAFLGIAAGHTVIGSLGSVCVVDGESMTPTYQSGARVFTGPIDTPIERGDIVMINDRNSEYALKRVVGLPGETVQLWRGYVFIDRKLLKEPYLPKYTFTFPDQHTGTWSFELGAGEYFVLGDNRLQSEDSRVYGPIGQKHIKSRVPLPDSTPRGRFAAYTLPPPGKRTIQPAW